MTPEQQAKIVKMQNFIKRSELYAMYHIAMATTGVTTKRKVFTGDHQLTPLELQEESLNTALHHIHSMEEATDNLALIIEGRENEIR